MLPELEPDEAEQRWERFIADLENELAAIEAGAVDVKDVGMPVWRAPRLGTPLPRHMRERVRALIERQERAAQELTNARLTIAEQLAALRGSAPARPSAVSVYLDSTQ